MTDVLIGLAVVLAFLGLSLPFVLSLIPWLGLDLIHRMRSIRWSLLVAAFGIAVAAYFLEPSTTATYAVAGVVLAAAASPLVTFGNVLVALDDPPEAAADEVALEADDLVLGFETEGTAKAWTFETLLQHNVTNDHIAGSPVLVVFCGLCRSGVVYDAVVDDRRLTFAVDNSWRRNMLLRDRQTRTLWQQATGEALVGKLAGASLAPLGGDLVLWDTWRREHPETSVAVETGGILTHLAKVMNEVVATKLVWPGQSPLDGRLPAKAPVAGITLAGESRAYPESELAPDRLVNDVVGGVPVAIVYDPEADRVQAYRRELDGEPFSLRFNGERLVSSDGDCSWDLSGKSVAGSTRLETIPVRRQWWFAWAEFHPDTEIYRPGGTRL